MRRSNYDLSTALVAIGAVAVLISLFLDWYGDPGQDAFATFELTDWLLVALAVGALVVVGTNSWSGGGAPNNRLAWICGALAFLVIVQVIDPPPSARGSDRDIGAWLALGGAVLMVAGAVLALAQISVTIDVTERERRRRTAAVDARAESDPSEAPTTASPSRSGGTGLWQAPSVPDGSTAPRSEPKAPTPDPDRTQPLRPVDHPGVDPEASGEGSGPGDAGDGDKS